LTRQPLDPEKNRLDLVFGFRVTRVFLVPFFFVSYLVIYLEIVSFVLAKNSALRSLSNRSIPMFRNFIPGLNYAGFVVPATIALLILISLVYKSRLNLPGLRLVVIRNRYWIFAIFLSVSVWYFIPGLASGGHTDFPLAILTCVYVGWKLETDRLRQSLLVSALLGFGIGFISDLQSQTFFTGIFGGWGLLDGDLLGTIVLPLAALSTLAILRGLPRKNVNDTTKKQITYTKTTTR
jgi:hypothetical protein